MPLNTPRAGKTEANKILERLLALPDGDLRNAISIAIEYKDHQSIFGGGGPAGTRLLVQLKYALEECESVLAERKELT